MADTSLIKKLGIKPKYRLLILHAPEGYREQLGTLPAGVELEKHGPMAIKLVKPGGLLWISYPKLSSKVPTDLSRNVLWEVFPNKEWRPVTQISIDEVWSALRFRPKSEVGT